MNAFTNKLVLPVAVKKTHLNRVYRIPCGPHNVYLLWLTCLSLSEKLIWASKLVNKCIISNLMFSLMQYSVKPCNLQFKFKGTYLNSALRKPYPWSSPKIQSIHSLTIYRRPTLLLNRLCPITLQITVSHELNTTVA